MLKTSIKKIPMMLVGWIVIYFLLCGIWQRAIPLLEGPDAFYHFAVIEHIKDRGALPPKTDADLYPWKQMTFHAPLYHILSAVLIADINTDDFESVYRLNPHAQIGAVFAEDNQNFVAHVGDKNEGTGLAIRRVRNFSAVLGALTLLAVYGLGRLIFTDQKWLAYVAMGLVLFNPQFLFIHNIVSNDTLITTLSSWALVGLVWMLKRGISMRELVGLSVLLGLASISKVSGLTLYPVVIVTLLVMRSPQALSWRQRLVAMGVIVAGGLLIGGWWYLNNLIEIGDFSGTYQIAQVTGLRVGGIADLTGELRGLLYSYWGVFGWFNILAPPFFYQWLAVVLIVTSVGTSIGIMRLKAVKSYQEILLFAFFILLFLLSWWRFHLMVNAAQGRLLFPLASLIALWMAWGLGQFGRIPAAIIVGGFALAAFLLPIQTLAPVYAIDPPVEMIEGQAEFKIREPWEASACLTVGVNSAEIEKDGIHIQSWWRADCPMSGYWSVFIHLIDEAQESCQVGDNRHIRWQSDSMLQGGRLNFPYLEVGKTYYDTFIIPLEAVGEDMVSPAIQIGLYDAGGGSFIRAFVESIQSDDLIGIGQCAPESIRFKLSSLKGVQ